MSDIEIAAVAALAAPSAPAAPHPHESAATAFRPPPASSTPEAPRIRADERAHATRPRSEAAPARASYWSLSAATLTAVERVLSSGAARADAAVAHFDAARDLVVLIRGKLLDAARPGADRARLQGEIATLVAELERASAAGARERPTDRIDDALDTLFRQEKRG